ALAVNLSSLVAKGWGWHLILKPVAPHSWRVAQEANLVGAAVNDLSVAVAGEAARVHLIVQRGGVPAGAAVSSVVWTRVAEGLALALFLVMAPSVLQLEPWLRGVQPAVGLALVVGLLLAWGRGWASLADRLTISVRSRRAYFLRRVPHIPDAGCGRAATRRRDDGGGACPGRRSLRRPPGWARDQRVRGAGAAAQRDRRDQSGRKGRVATISAYPFAEPV